MDDEIFVKTLKEAMEGNAEAIQTIIDEYGNSRVCKLASNKTSYPLMDSISFENIDSNSSALFSSLKESFFTSKMSIKTKLESVPF